MESRNVMVAVVAMLIATALLPEKTSAGFFFAGGFKGWQVATNAFKAKLARKGALEFLDIIFDKSQELYATFNFTNDHNVAEVTKDEFDRCDTVNHISLQNNGLAKFALDTVGERYFICTVDDHCSNGQKLVINVDSDMPPSGSPTSLSGTTDTAASISAFSLLFMSLVIAFVC